MILEAMSGKKSPWAKNESEFAQDFDLAAEYRAIRDRDDFEHELAPSVTAYLTEKYDWEPEPISRIHGDKLGMYAKKYIQWCEELGVRAVQGSAIWVAAFLDELREQGFADLSVVREAISRTHYLMGHSDPTHHPMVDAVIENNLRKKETEELAYDDKSPQGTTKFTGKIYDKMIADADRDQKVMGGKLGTREVPVLEMDNDDMNDRRNGGPAALPRKEK